MVFANLDGTLRRGNGALDAAIAFGKGKEAKELFSDLFYKAKDIVKDVEPSSLMRKIDEMDAAYYSTMSRGAELLKGRPVSIASDIRYEPTPQCDKIIELSKGDKPIEIGTLTDEVFAKKFLEVNNLSDCCKIVSSSKLATKNGYYTGKIERYSGFRGKKYSGGPVFATSIADILPCVKAYPKNQIYIVNGDNDYINVENHILEKTLNRIGIPSKELNFL